MPGLGLRGPPVLKLVAFLSQLVPVTDGGSKHALDVVCVSWLQVTVVPSAGGRGRW